MTTQAALMQLTAIDTTKLIRLNYDKFRQHLYLPSREKRKIGNRNGADYQLINVHHDLGFWVFLGRGTADLASWNPFGDLDGAYKIENKTLPMVCQINFPPDGINRKIAGLFAEDSKGRVYVTHSGRLGGGRSGISQTGFLDYIESTKARVQWAHTDWKDGTKPTRRIVIGCLDDDSFRKRVAAFVRLSAEFKNHLYGPPSPEASRPNSRGAARPPRGQGYEPDPEVRRAVEDHAMCLIEAHYKAQKYSVMAVHRQPGELDLRCVRNGVELRVEVKGTTSAGKSVELTAAEVKYATRGDPPVHLAVVSNINVDSTRTPPVASGGDIYIYKNFTPSEHKMEATRFRCTLEHSRGK